MSEGREKARQEAMMWFLATMLATGELYGSETFHTGYGGMKLTSVQALWPSARNGFREIRSSR